MKDTHVSLASVSINTVDNLIPRERIEIESKNGTCSLKDGIQVRLDWPLAIMLAHENDELDVQDYSVAITDVNRTPRGIVIEVLLSDLDDVNVITKVALAEVSRLKIYADFPEDNLTFELISPGGESYGIHSISIWDEKLKKYFVINDD